MAGQLILWLSGGVVYGGIALLAAALLARLAGFPILDGAWRANPVTFYGAFVIVLAVVGFVAQSFLRWQGRARRTRDALRQAITADQQAGRVDVADHAVTGIKLLQEPEHLGYIFLLHLETGKTLVLYDHDSIGSEQDLPGGGKPTLVVRERISLRTFPVSKRKRWSFEGDPVPIPAPIELVLGPENWPEDESWCRVKWENIERHYGPKTQRQTAASSFS